MKALTLLLITFLSLNHLSAQVSPPKLRITPLTGDFYVFTTYNSYKGTLVPANGMYLVTNAGVVMFDTPWDTTQFQPILDSIKVRHGKELLICIATHSHKDKTAGLVYFKNYGVKTYTTRQTDEICKIKGENRAEFLMDRDTTFNVGQYSFQTYFPGAGHTPDNIVIWFGKDKVLYGGCLVKSVEATDLGNLEDANVKAWPQTLKNILGKFKPIKFVIPGHQGWTDKRSLEHTLALIEARQRNQ